MISHRIVLSMKEDYLWKIIGTWFLGNSPFCPNRALTSFLLLGEPSLSSGFAPLRPAQRWGGCSGRATPTAMLASLVVASLPHSFPCFCGSTRSFQVGWPHTGTALISYGGFTYYMFRFSSQGENFVLSRILFSFQSWLGQCSRCPFSHYPYLLVCSFQHPTFFGEHFLEGEAMFV